MNWPEPLPDGVAQYSRTALFDQASVPDKLTSAHRTKPGVWGRLSVEAGALEYVIDDPASAQCGQRVTIAAGASATIRPAELHHVSLSGPVQFRVKFYR